MDYFCTGDKDQALADALHRVEDSLTPTWPPMTTSHGMKLTRARILQDECLGDLPSRDKNHDISEVSMGL